MPKQNFRPATTMRPNIMPPSTMPMDAYRHENNLVISFDLPGVDAGAVEVTLESNSLKVVAPRPRPTTEGIQWLTAERAYGTATWQLPLGDDVDVDALQAHVANGVLTITLPVIEPASRRFEVTTGVVQPDRAHRGSGRGLVTAPSNTRRPRQRRRGRLAPGPENSPRVVEGGGQVGTQPTGRQHHHQEHHRPRDRHPPEAEAVAQRPLDHGPDGVDDAQGQPVEAEDPGPQRRSAPVAAPPSPARTGRRCSPPPLRPGPPWPAAATAPPRRGRAGREGSPGWSAAPAGDRSGRQGAPWPALPPPPPPPGP